MDAIDGLASNIGYAVITAFVSTVALWLVIAWRPAYWAAKMAFLCAWGGIGVLAPLYSYFVISLPAGKPISGALASILCLIVIGGPFLYFGWPKLRRTLRM